MVRGARKEKNRKAKAPFSGSPTWSTRNVRFSAPWPSPSSQESYELAIDEFIG